MKQTAIISIFRGYGQLIELSEVKIPALHPGEILVRNVFGCICSSDLHTYCGRRVEKTPTTLGHEVVGIIESLPVGDTITDLRGNLLLQGDRITWAIYASNPAGKLAQMGIPQKSDGLFKYGHELLSEHSSLHGGFASHTLLRANTPIIKVDERVPNEILSIVNCSVATVAGAIRLAGNLTGKQVLISGLGMLGLVACAMCHTNGATVLASDIDNIRVETAKKFGAQPASINDTVDVVLEFSGATAAMENTVSRLEIGGIAVWVGATYALDKTGLDAAMIVRKLLTIKGLHNYNSNDLLQAVRFMEQYHATYPFLELITNGFGLAQLNEAFEYAHQNNVYRVGVDLNNQL